MTVSFCLANLLLRNQAHSEVRVYCVSDKFQDLRVYSMNDRHFYAIQGKLKKRMKALTFFFCKTKRCTPCAAKIRGKNMAYPQRFQ